MRDEGSDQWSVISDQWSEGGDEAGGVAGGLEVVEAGLDAAALVAGFAVLLGAHVAAGWVGAEGVEAGFFLLVGEAAVGPEGEEGFDVLRGGHGGAGSWFWVLGFRLGGEVGGFGVAGDGFEGAVAGGDGFGDEPAAGFAGEGDAVVGGLAGFEVELGGDNPRGEAADLRVGDEETAFELRPGEAVEVLAVAAVVLGKVVAENRPGVAHLRQVVDFGGGHGGGIWGGLRDRVSGGRGWGCAG